MQNKEPFYKSTKKLLGVIGFVLYWGLQIPAVLEDPQVIVSLSMENAIFVAALLGIKTAGGVLASRKEK
ncbi:MAG: hypothetical protein GY777_26075 [Candidatus Brocadiaceae bacterium]|nr:hypothetical protein [Candidatus Brocadiaceae bacterium]